MNSEETYTTETFFFDTYAFYEIYSGNKSYLKYKECNIITTNLNLFEIYLAIFREDREKEANEIFDSYFKFVKDFDENVIKEAVKMKKILNRRHLSMTDCIGYSLAKQLGIKFLTGDSQFADMENVEFIK